MPAKFLSRLSAWIIDMSIVILISLPFIFSFFIIAQWSQSDIGYILSLFAAQLAISGILAVYYIICMKRANHIGQSLGKQVMKIKTVDIDGSEISNKIIAYREVLVKYWLFTVISAAFFFLPLIVNGLFCLFHSEKKSLVDIFTHTKVIDVN